MASAPPAVEFSASLVKRVEGRRFEAQVFAKSDRLRLEYKYAIKTELGYSSIEIIRLDKRESWFVLAQRRQILSVPIKPEEILPIQPSLPGEKSRTLVGDAITTGRPSQLYDVRVDYNGRDERFYEWVDAETGIVLKLVSQDRDWSVEYVRIRPLRNRTTILRCRPGINVGFHHLCRVNEDKEPATVRKGFHGAAE